MCIVDFGGRRSENLSVRAAKESKCAKNNKAAKKTPTSSIGIFDTHDIA